MILHLKFEFTTNQKKENAINYSQNLAYNNYRMGWKTDIDINNKKFANCYGVLAALNLDYGNFYFRSNCLNRFVGLGWFNKTSVVEA